MICGSSGVRRRVTYRIWFATTRPGGVSCSHWACTGWAGTTPAKPTTSPSCNPSARTGAGQPLRLGTDLPGNAASPDPGPATALASWTQPTATAAIPIADTLRPALYLSFCRAAKYPALAGISRYDIPAWARRACPCGQSPSGPEVVAVPAISGNGFARDATAHWVVAARGALVDRQDPPRLGAGRRPGSANDPPGDSAKHSEEARQVEPIEYMTMACDDDAAHMIERLNELGAQGWRPAPRFTRARAAR